MSKNKNGAKDSWLSFWNAYRNREACDESDLFFQVGKTVNKVPIPVEAFRYMVDRIADKLQLTTDDHLMDYCCGNGLLTYEFAKRVRNVTAIDFTTHLIVTARRLKALPNITYCLGDVKAPLHTLLSCQNLLPNAFLMYDALAYFEPKDLNAIIKNILHLLDKRPFRMFLGHIPNSDLKWNFYNTPERRARHLENEKNPANTNDGLGRWWSANEIEQLCQQLGLTVSIENQPPELSNYRMDALISSKLGNPSKITL